jgi:hypothetical protein
MLTGRLPPWQAAGVQDVTDAFLAAKARGRWPVEQLCTAVREDPGFAGLRVDWDQQTAEEWLRLLHTSTVWCLVWCPAPLVVVTTGHRELAADVGRVTGVAPEVVAVPHLDSPVLRLRRDRLGEIWPDVQWPDGAVDPDAMSAHDLWYVTG